jgi:nucleotide-binding universal stress UspA family protein
MLMVVRTLHSRAKAWTNASQGLKLILQLCTLHSHNKGAIQRLFLGSTSDYCVKHCAQPLIVIR